MAVPDWAPAPTRVAEYVPARTLVAATNTYAGTFTAATRPTATQVADLINGACAWVLVRTGAVDASLADMAAATAAVYAAASVERGYPDRAADVDTAGQLYQQALAMRDDLDAANRAVTGTDTTDPAGAVAVLSAFPPPPAWGDLNL